MDDTGKVTIDISNIPADATGYIEVNVTGLDGSYKVVLPVDSSNNYVVLPVIDTVGTYTLTAQYMGDKNYNKSKVSETTFTVTKWNATDLQKLIDDAIAAGNSSVSLNHDFELEDGPVNITGPITIEGNGHTIDANGTSGVFNISSPDVDLENMTITNVDGTAIQSTGDNTTINNVVLDNITGTGIQVDGDNATISNITASDSNATIINATGDNAEIKGITANDINGTVIANSGEGSTISDVTADNVDGTVIANSGEGSTISDVTANGGTGPVVDNSGNNTNIDNVTANDVDGTVIANSGNDLTISNVTAGSCC